MFNTSDIATIKKALQLYELHAGSAFCGDVDESLCDNLGLMELKHKVNTLSANELPFELTDGEDSAQRCGASSVIGSIDINHDVGVSLKFNGFSTIDSQDDVGLPIHIEYYAGELRVLVWSDINKDDPTHIIPLNGAKNSNREPDEESEIVNVIEESTNVIELSPAKVHLMSPKELIKSDPRYLTGAQWYHLDGIIKEMTHKERTNYHHSIAIQLGSWHLRHIRYAFNVGVLTGINEQRIDIEPLERGDMEAVGNRIASKHGIGESKLRDCAQYQEPYVQRLLEKMNYPPLMTAAIIKWHIKGVMTACHRGIFNGYKSSLSTSAREAKAQRILSE
jgi:hypothetical protein